MIKTFKYYENWKNESLICPTCRWNGTACAARDDDLPDGDLYCCPQCKAPVPLLLVMFPTAEEKRTHWDQLDEAERQSLLKREAFLSEFEARGLKRPEQLPEVDLETFEVQWDEQVTEAGVDVILRIGATIIHSQPRTWEGAEYFGEAAKILRQRYGNRMSDLVPTPRSELYLYGDDTGAPAYIDSKRAELTSDEDGIRLNSS